MRICSFLPSATEIVYALGLGDSLHGVSHECDYPEDARSKPRVVKSRVDSTRLRSREIDRLVSEMASRGERIYQVDQDVLGHARPDLVLTQQLCEVCAISLEDVEEAVAHLPSRPRLLSLDPHSLDDMLEAIADVGQHTGAATRAGAVVADLRRRIDAVRARSATAGGSPPRVACVEWLDPLITAGHWVPEMVEAAGGEDVLSRPGAPSRRIEFDELAASAPEAIVLMPCGLNVEAAHSEFSSLQDLDRWRELPAARAGRVYAVDSGALFSRAGPRLVDGIELLGQLIHPDLFPGQPDPQYGRTVAA